MSFFNFFKKNSTSRDSDDSPSENNFSDLDIYEIHEFERTYNYSVEVFEMYTDHTEIVEGEITFHGEVFWDEFEEVFEYELHTSESTGKFEPNEFTGHDGLEEKFLNEYKNYLLNRGVDSSNIAW